MLSTETMFDGRVRTYSDAGMYIRQAETDILYEDAVDPESENRIYTETDIPLPVPQGGEATAEDYEAALAEMGVEV